LAAMYTLSGSASPGYVLRLLLITAPLAGIAVTAYCAYSEVGSTYRVVTGSYGSSEGGAPRRGPDCGSFACRNRTSRVGMSDCEGERAETCACRGTPRTYGACWNRPEYLTAFSWMRAHPRQYHRQF
jgi:hypothetical protein